MDPPELASEPALCYARRGKNRATPRLPIIRRGWYTKAILYIHFWSKLGGRVQISRKRNLFASFAGHNGFGMQRGIDKHNTPTSVGASTK